VNTFVNLVDVDGATHHLNVTHIVWCVP